MQNGDAATMVEYLNTGICEGSRNVISQWVLFCRLIAPI